MKLKKLSDEVIQFLHKQGFVIVSTISQNDSVHNSCKGIVKLNQDGRIYLLDLYQGQTWANLKHNHHIAITAVDEHRFKGFCLQGKAKVIAKDRLSHHVISAWEKRLTHRLTQRVLRNIKGEKGHERHPEVLLPQPEYMIMMEVEKIVDLTPHHLK